MNNNCYHYFHQPPFNEQAAGSEAQPVAAWLATQCTGLLPVSISFTWHHAIPLNHVSSKSHTEAVVCQAKQQTSSKYETDGWQTFISSRGGTDMWTNVPSLLRNWDKQKTHSLVCVLSFCDQFQHMPMVDLNHGHVSAWGDQALPVSFSADMCILGFITSCDNMWQSWEEVLAWCKQVTATDLDIMVKVGHQHKRMNWVF